MKLRINLSELYGVFLIYIHDEAINEAIKITQCPYNKCKKSYTHLVRL